MGSHALLLLLYYIWLCVTCVRASARARARARAPWPQCSILELVFSEAEIRSFSKAKSRLVLPGARVYSI